MNVFDTGPVRLVDDGSGVVRVVLDRPEASNAIGADSFACLRGIAAVLEHLDGLRCVVLESAVPGVFSVGGDLKLIDGADGDAPSVVHGGARDAHALVLAMARIDAPVVAAVNGIAAGGGLGLALGADFVLAGRSARLTPAYAKIGYPSDCGLSWILPRLVGQRRALDLLLRSPVIDAEEALELGLVTAVVDDERLADAVDELVEELRRGPTTAFGMIKRLVRDASASALELHLEHEARLIARAAGGREAQARIASFVTAGRAG